MENDINKFLDEVIEGWKPEVYARRKAEPNWHDPSWRKLRSKVLKAASYRCLRCGKRFLVSLLTAHHLLPRSEGGKDTFQNLVALCEPCHNYVEIHGYRTRTAIVGSMTYVVLESELKPPPAQRGDEDWRAEVYSGKKTKKRKVSLV